MRKGSRGWESPFDGNGDIEWSGEEKQGYILWLGYPCETAYEKSLLSNFVGDLRKTSFRAMCESPFDLVWERMTRDAEVIDGVCDAMYAHCERQLQPQIMTCG